MAIEGVFCDGRETGKAGRDAGAPGDKGAPGDAGAPWIGLVLLKRISGARIGAQL